MPKYINVGVRDSLDNSDIPTKKALKERLAAKPASVAFYVTDALNFNPGFSGRTFNGDNLPKQTESGEPVNYTVTGPNAYNKRNWYANVTISDKTGQPVVK